MLRKMLIALATASVLAVSFSGIALAAEDHPEGIRVRGELISVDHLTGKFSIETNEGSIKTFFVNEMTHFRGKAEKIEELEVGWKVGVGAREEEGKLWAVLVLTGDPEDFTKARGKVTDINTSAGKFTIERPDGEKLTFFVNENTRYDGQISDLDDLQEGWHAEVVAKKESPGKLLAVMVIAGARPEVVRAQGIIVGVDPSSEEFQLEKSDGSVLTFFVDDKTTYKGQVEIISDLEEGMRAGVGGYENSEGQWIARVILAGNPPDERPELIRAQGTVKTVNPGAGKFQLEKPDGSVLTVHVDSKTRYKGQVGSFDDLEKGMRAGFAGYIDSDGKIIARIVLAGKPRPERPERPGGVKPGGEQPAPQSGVPLEDKLLTPDL